MLIVRAFSAFGNRLVTVLVFVIEHVLPSPVTVSNIFWNIEVMAYLLTVQTADLV